MINEGVHLIGRKNYVDHVIPLHKSVKQYRQEKMIQEKNESIIKSRTLLAMQMVCMML